MILIWCPRIETETWRRTDRVGLKEAVEEAKRPGEVDQSPRTLRRCLAEIAPSRRRWDGRVAQPAGGGTGTAGRRFRQGGRGVGKEERGRQLRA